MRKTMYFKDDDARLSFLLGNYITLTNLSKREVERIIALHISPDKRLRPDDKSGAALQDAAQPRAGETIDAMRRFAKAGIVDELPDRLLPRPQRRGGASALDAGS